jgi:hypothetical protein
MNISAKKWLAVIPLTVVVIGAAYLYRQASTQASFLGLPTVPCVDPTKPVLQNYSLNISIFIQGKPYPLAPSIGHDPGNCLRDIHTNDGSGLVYIEANDMDQYTLGNFFETWRKTFNSGQLAEHAVTSGHSLQVFVNGTAVSTFESTPLVPGSTIGVVYR